MIQLLRSRLGRKSREERELEVLLKEHGLNWRKINSYIRNTTFPLGKTFLEQVLYIKGITQTADFPNIFDKYGNLANFCYVDTKKIIERVHNGQQGVVYDRNENSYKSSITFKSNKDSKAEFANCRLRLHLINYLNHNFLSIPWEEKKSLSRQD